MPCTKKWLLTRLPHDELAYKQYRSIFKKVAVQAETSYFKQRFDNHTNSIKQLWSNLNTVCSFKNNRSKNQLITKLKTNQVNYATKPEDISNQLNNFFSTVGENLVKDLFAKNPSQNVDFHFFCHKSTNKSIFIEPTNKRELLELVSKLRKSKSPGPDNIGPGLIKEVIESIVDPLLYIFNLSMLDGIVPDKLKTAKVVPIFKKGDRSLACNYRPISLLSVFDKLLEKLMYKRVYTFLVKHNILYKHQFGFRKNYSTALALIEVMDNIYKKLDEQHFVLGIFLDLQKAFDTVNHEILLHKLYNYGIRGIAHDWFRSYLSNRLQFTVANGASSSLAKITCGVPQGSVLGPLLFLLYVNDIANSVPDQNIKLFADDTNLFISTTNQSVLNSIANEAMSNLNSWFIANRLSLNLDKTCYMVFSPRRLDLSIDFNLQLNGTAIHKVKSCRYLGIIIDDELKWSEHIEHIYSSLLKYVGIFYKLRNRIPASVLKNVYYAFVHSYILYGIEVYANTLPTYLAKLIKLNNKLLRILQNQPRCCHVNDLYVTYNTLSLPDLRDMQLLILVHKTFFHVDLLPDVFSNYFSLNSSIHDHLTRTQSNIHIHRADTTFGQRTIRYKGGTLWNSLSQDLKTTSSTNQFKKKLKHLFLIDNQ